MRGQCRVEVEKKRSPSLLFFSYALGWIRMTEGLIATPCGAMVVPTPVRLTPTGAKLTSSEVRVTPVTE